ncbi:cbb3-type cytochrome c oxidase subunit 3 [Draconibacterium sp. IB214405]|uniref:cbb3-type cytochrome c oxidase subunit 3 n=1 Tax=Draconibacterium sp. IB214405 TaxID=3097352 RepID=UPI002A132C6A|nr:cbb3-type cytochrome c oxidase subunit 3 [Draconibacterium sp. IB214405]MDX8338376.1 cbb3-type cytochrome c oxidase subunit 3 [Draconibacterium sp. IB214405]
MKIVSNVLTSIEEIQIFYIIGLLIFVILFIVIFIRTMRRPNEEMEDYKNSILTDSESGEIKISN